MTLSAVEFLRRFVLHVLPERFVRVRRYGFLANRNREERLALCRSLLVSTTSGDPEPLDGSCTTGVLASDSAGVCPGCRMQVTEVWARRPRFTSFTLR